MWAHRQVPPKEGGAAVVSHGEAPGRQARKGGPSILQESHSSRCHADRRRGCWTGEGRGSRGRATWRRRAEGGARAPASQLDAHGCQDLLGPAKLSWPLADPTSWTASRAAEEEEGAGGTWMGSSGQSPVLPRGLGQLEPRPRGQRPRTVCNSRVVHSSDLKQAEAQNQTRCLCTWVCMSVCAWGCVHVWRGGENACA